MSKVKFGLSGFEYGIVDDKEKVSESKKLPGMTSAKMDLTNEFATVAADDGPYVVLSAGITDAKLEIENLDLNSDARKDFFGIKVEDGIEAYNKNMTPNDVSVMFRTRTDDGKSIWVGLMKGKFSIPGMDTKTKEGSPDPSKDSTTGNFVGYDTGGDDDDRLILIIGREDNEDFDLETFRAKVFPKA